jgi:hypothetical protein
LPPFVADGANFPSLLLDFDSRECHRLGDSELRQEGSQFEPSNNHFFFDYDVSANALIHALGELLLFML